MLVRPRTMNGGAVRGLGLQQQNQPQQQQNQQQQNQHQLQSLQQTHLGTALHSSIPHLTSRPIAALPYAADTNGNQPQPQLQQPLNHAVSGIPIGHWGGPPGHSPAPGQQLQGIMMPQVPAGTAASLASGPPSTLPTPAQQPQHPHQMVATTSAQHLPGMPAMSYMVDPYYSSGMMAAGMKPPPPSSAIVPVGAGGSRVPIPQENTTVDEVPPTLLSICSAPHHGFRTHCSSCACLPAFLLL